MTKQYIRPSTLLEAIQLAQQPDTIAIAGGAMAFQGFDLPYEIVIDLQAIPELTHIEEYDNAIEFGGACTLQQILDTPDVPMVLKQALSRTVPRNIRNNTSIGESLQVDNPPSEWLAGLTVLDIGIRFAGEEAIYPLIELLEDDELQGGIISAVFIPKLEAGEALGSAYVSRTPSDEAIVNVAVFIRVEDDGVVETAFAAFCGASDEVVSIIHLENLEEHQFNQDAIEQTVKPIPSLLNPDDDYQGSAAYRQEMAKVCLQRALEDAMAGLKA